MKLDIMTMKEVAEELKVPMSSMYKYLREGIINGVKIGKHWRISREALIEFVTKEEAKPAHEKAVQQNRKKKKIMKGDPRKKRKPVDVDGSVLIDKDHMSWEDDE